MAIAYQLGVIETVLQSGLGRMSKGSLEKHHDFCGFPSSGEEWHLLHPLVQNQNSKYILGLMQALCCSAEFLLWN